MQQLRVLPHFFQQQASFLIVYLNRQVVSKQEPGRVTIFDFENVSKRYYYSRYISMIINHKRDGRASTWTLSSQLPRMIRRQRRVSRDRSIDGTNMGGEGKACLWFKAFEGGSLDASGEVFLPVLSGWKRGLFEQSKGQGPVKYFKAASILCV